MAFGSCFSCFKYSVFLFNFLLWLLGCSLLAVGGWLISSDDAGRFVQQMTSTSTGGDAPMIVSYSQVTGSDVTSILAYLFIVFGCIIVIVAFIGCCGAVRENRCMLGTFLVALFVIFAVLLGIGIWSFVVRNRVDAHTVQLQRLTFGMVRNAVPKYYTDRNSKHFLDSIQKKFHCCGADNAAGDYVRTGSINPPPCELADQQRSCLRAYFDYVGDHFEDFMRDRLVIMGSVAIGIAISLVIGMLCVLLLWCAVRERNWSTTA